jgi:hypothetical protein
MRRIRLWTIRQRTTALLFCVVLTIPQTATASRQDLYDRFFANVLAGQPCFARTYDDAYLAAHPKQQVQSIEIDLSKSNSDGTPNTPDHFELGFALMLKTSPEWYGQAASCETGDEGFDCYLEADGGVFRLTPTNDGGLRLQTGDNGVVLEGSDSVQLSGKTGDDRVFDLVPAKEECEAANAYFSSDGE